MSEPSRQAHWENVYTTRDENQVSWFQERPAISLELIKAAGAPPRTSVIDVGGGASRLADVLLEEGYEDVTVLDISEAALLAARSRLALQLLFLKASESMGNHDSKVVDADSVD
jgi:ribosomal protein L11 methylase PrmA